MTVHRGEHVFIGLGSNLGDRAGKLAAARAELEKLAGSARCSSVYETAPWQVGTQPKYLNQVCQIETDLEPERLMARLLAIEKRLGRKRRLFRGEPRLIDIDLLLYGDRVVDSKNVRLPHPRMADRAFVLAPLAELAPGLVHPVLRRTVSDLLRAADSTGVEKYVAT